MKSLYRLFLFSHLLLCTLGAALAIGLCLLSPAFAVSPLWALTVPLMAWCAWFFGKKAAPLVESAQRDACWNLAAGMFVLSAALLLLLWRFGERMPLPLSLLNLWNLPAAAPLLGLDALAAEIPADKHLGGIFTRTDAYRTLVQPLLGLLLAALEPLCFTLPLTRGKQENHAEIKE